MRNDAGGSFVILGTFIFAFFFSLLPVPAAAAWVRPEWVVLLLIYWVMALPHRVGMFWAAGLGLVMDVMRDTVLGSHVVSFALITLFTLVLHKRLRNFPVLQQSGMVMVLTGINQLIFHWMQRVTGTVSGEIWFLLPALTSGIVWPWVFIVLRGIRRTFHIR